MKKNLLRLLFLCAALLLLGGCAAGEEGLPTLTPIPTSAPPAPTPGSEWVHIAPGGGGWFMCVGAGPTGILVVGSDVSGAYRSLDRGRSWDVIGSYRGLGFTHVSAVGFDPADESIIYLGLDGGLYRSGDAGETFQKVVSGGYWGAIAISPADPDVGYAAWIAGWNGTRTQVYRTADRGFTWDPVTERGSLPDGVRALRLVVHPTDPDTLYLISGEHRFATGAKAAYRSTDGGVHWIRLAADLGDVYDLALDPSSPATLYAAVEEEGVYRSDDGGKTWSHLTDVWGRLFVRSSDVIRLIDYEGVWESTDGGASWYRKGSPEDWDPGWEPGWHYGEGAGSTFGGDLSDPDAYYWVNAQFVYGSFDGGATFGPLYTVETPPGSNWWRTTGIDNVEVYDLEISEADHNVVYIGMWDMGLWRSLDYGETWQSCNQDEFGWEEGKGGDVRTVLTDPARPEVVWAGSRRTGAEGVSEHLIRSDRYGEAGSWVEVGEGLPDPGLAAEIWGLSLDRNSPVESRTLFVTAGGKVYRSTDDGYTWSRVFSGGRARITAVDRFDGGLVYAGGDGGFWRSTDGGDTWERVGLPEMRGVYDIEVDPSNPGWVYVACYGNGLGVYRSKDGGEHWEKLWTNNVARGVAVDPTNPDVIYATSSLNDCCGAGPAGSAGVVRSVDGGRTWQQVNEGLPWPFAWPIEVDPVDPSYIFIGAPGTGYYRRRF